MTIQTSNPPVSRPTQELIDLCVAVAQGGTDRAPELQARMKARQSGLSGAWEDFGKALEAESEEFVTHRKTLIEAVEAQFLAYSHALDKIAAFMENSQTHLLSEAAAELAQASPALLMAQSAYEASVLTAGPSRFATINLFENMARGLLSGKIPVERWKAACEGHYQFYTTLIAEIDASASAGEPGVPERRAAAAKILAVLQRLEELSNSRDAAAFQAAIHSLTPAHLELEAAVTTYNFHAFSKTPTQSPEANRVIHAAEGLRDGTLPAEVLKGLAQHFQEQVRTSLVDVRAATRMPAESSVVSEEVPKMLEAMQSMDEALDILKDIAAASEEMDSALSQLKAAVERLSQSNQSITQHNESFGKKICPRCHAYNEANARACDKCHGAMPQFAGSSVYGSWAAESRFQIAEGGGATGARDIVVTKTMKALSDACENYEKGQLSQHDFMVAIKEIEEKVVRAELMLARLSLPEIPEDATEEEQEKANEFLDLGGDAIGLLAQGVGDCMSGLMKLEKYAREDHAGDMRDGLRLFFEGCQRLFQIQHVAKLFVDALPPIPEGATAEPEEKNPTPADEGHVTL